MTERKTYRCFICNGSWIRKCQYMNHLKTNKHLKNAKLFTNTEDEEMEKKNQISENDTNKIIQRYDQLIDHLLNQNSKLVNQIDKLEKKISSLKKDDENSFQQTNYNTQVNVSNNLNLVTYNVDIRAFGKENWDHLSSEIILPVMKQVNSAIPEIVRMLHFSREHPENHNIRISNKKLNHVTVFDGTKWSTRNKNNTIETIVSNIVDKLETNYEFDFLKNSSFHVKQLWQILRDRTDSKQQKQIKNDVELILYDNRKMITIS